MASLVRTAKRVDKALRRARTRERESESERTRTDEHTSPCGGRERQKRRTDFSWSRWMSSSFMSVWRISLLLMTARPLCLTKSAIVLPSVTRVSVLRHTTAQMHESETHMPLCRFLMYSRMFSSFLSSSALWYLRGIWSRMSWIAPHARVSSTRHIQRHTSIGTTTYACPTSTLATQGASLLARTGAWSLAADPTCSRLCSCAAAQATADGRTHLRL